MDQELTIEQILKEKDILFLETSLNGLYSAPSLELVYSLPSKINLTYEEYAETESERE